MNAIQYRPDIDGLRAIAVLAVILFHAGFSGVSGGYVGVDIFFVISGFLITSLILKDLRNGDFSLASFWERRARRILPALIFVVFATAIAGWFLLLPEDYASLGKEIAAQSVFSSNFLFYKQAGYFDAASDLKPLLHTWSLSVEEQFYIFFPLACLFVWNKFRSKIFVLLVTFAVLSLVLCQIVMRANPDLAFFMLPFRAWELLVGSLLAYRMPLVPERFRSPLSIVGILSILVAVLFYSNDTLFPGVTAILPCFGAAAIIAAGPTALVNRALSLRPLVFVGLVSYSWYLWHWPVMVFAKYHPLLTFDSIVAASCIVASFLLAVASWRYVETPFRKFRMLKTRRSIFSASLVGILCFAIFGSGIFMGKGLPERLSQDVAQYAFGIGDDNPMRKQCDKTPVSDIAADRICETNGDTGIMPSFLLWGDSHADAIAPLFFSLSQEYGQNGYVATHHGCPPVLDYWRNEWNSGYSCLSFNAAMVDVIKRKNIKNVILVANWIGWIGDDSGVRRTEGEPEKDVFAYKWKNTINHLRSLGVNIYVFKDVPVQVFDVPRVLAKQALYSVDLNPSIKSREAFMTDRAARLDPFVSSLGKTVRVIDPLDMMCPEDVCLYERDGYSLYYNAGHISTRGAVYLKPLFEDHFKKGF